MALTTNTPSARTGARPQRISEGTASAQVINTMPRPLLLDTGPKPAPAKLRLIKPVPASAACGFGTCALDPACTSDCRYREADRHLRSHYSARHTQRAAMPPLPVTDHSADRDHRARRWTAWLLISWSVFWMCAVVGWAFYV